MRPKYRIALSGRRGAFVDRVARELGPVTAIGADGWLEDCNAVIVDCTDASLPRNPDDWRRALDQGKPLGLFGMHSEDQALLAQITGRPLSGSIRSLFVRGPSPGRSERYTFTIVPPYEETMEPVDAVAMLASRVFTSSPVPVNPPEAINNLWPVDSQYGALFASRRTMISGWQAVGVGPFDNSQVTFNAVGHFFRANGDGGDQAYHVIILSRMSGVIGLAPTDATRFGFGLRVMPSDAPQNVYSTQPSGYNSPGPPPNWGPLGEYICTSFDDVQIPVIGTLPGNSRQETFILTPSFTEYRNTVTTPGIDNFFVMAGDSTTYSDVQFNMADDFVGDEPSAAGRFPARPNDGNIESDTDAFVVISYFTFTNPSVVNFTFKLGFFFWTPVGNSGVRVDTSFQTQTVPIDLAVATKLAPLN
ncbi:hypothetical protein [Rhizobium sp. FY34]|uniref:hypothetical protein n=1 Tax=Rhizobium sp. FY34 TaxID=2562309 RepID=UPI0010C0F053|nr:hypothetical protein [Rhizobium sp. FY34]